MQFVMDVQNSLDDLRCESHMAHLFSIEGTFLLRDLLVNPMELIFHGSGSNKAYLLRATETACLLFISAELYFCKLQKTLAVSEFFFNIFK